jgi:hypothetical protein
MSSAAMGAWPIEEPACRAEIDLAALMREAGWPCPEGASRPFHVELETPEPATARVAQREPEGVVVSVDLELETEGAATPASDRALELLLRRVGAEIRSVRSVRDGRADGVAARLEVVLGDDPGPDDMDRALGALSVAWRGAVREARLLHRDDAIARHYVALFELQDRSAGAVPAAVTKGKGNPE